MFILIFPPLHGSREKVLFLPIIYVSQPFNVNTLIAYSLRTIADDHITDQNGCLGSNKLFWTVIFTDHISQTNKAD